MLRKCRQVRITAPAFTAMGGDGMTGNGLGLGALFNLSALGAEGVSAVAGADGETSSPPQVPEGNGTFTIRLAPGMRILAHNTASGPLAEGAARRCPGRSRRATRDAPTELIVLTR